MSLPNHAPDNRAKAFMGECEVCEAKTMVTPHYNNTMNFCDECWAKEEEFTKSPGLAEAITPVAPATLENIVVKQAKQIDDTIQIRTDLFNAKTVAIVELKKAIDADSSIENKPYKLAETLKTRFDHLKSIVFELQQQLQEAGNEQKAIQVYLNNLANQLRTEEREKLHIADINYKPTQVRTPTVRKISTSQSAPKAKLDKKELRKYAAEMNISEFTLHMICVQKGISVADAASYLKKIAEDKD